MMLLVFARTADIPMKMSNFYARAFQTLLYLHDASKGQFSRKLKSGLQEDDFRSVFSAFCAITYMMPLFKFSREQFEDIIKKASDVNGIKVVVKDYAEDLIQCVCLMQNDGLDIVFSHRSFQEFFCAEFILKKQNFDVKTALDAISYRGSDSVIKLLYEMDSDFIEEKWIVPRIKEICSLVEGINVDVEPHRFLNVFDIKFSIIDDIESRYFMERSDARLYHIRNAIFDIYNLSSISDMERTITTDKANEIFMHLIKNKKLNTSEGDVVLRYKSKSTNKKISEGGERIIKAHKCDFSDIETDLLHKLGIVSNLEKQKKSLIDIGRRVEARSKRSANLVKDLFKF